jgi:hypothetical protein
MMRTRHLVLFVIVAAASVIAVGCRNADFDPASKVEAVRILATRSDKPYAKPGDTVNMEVLAYDGRPHGGAPMKVYWVPIACIDPPGDSYFACYPGFAQLPAGVDIESKLTEGPMFSFTMPANVIAMHTKKGGAVDAVPSGLAVVFTIACAGHVRYLPRAEGDSPNALPLGCFDDNHAQLGPDDYVFSYSLVYAFTDRMNANPVVTTLTFGGTPVDVTKGITLDHCASAAADANRSVNTSSCPTTALDIVLPDSTQEVDPGNPDPAGNPLKEEIRAQYLMTDGHLDHDTVNLFDARSGRITPTSVQLTAPATAGENMLWAVVRDSRGGTTWVSVPMHVK